MCRYVGILSILSTISLPRRHIITPSTALPEGVWLALVARGCRLQMNVVDPVKVMRFIKERALRGPKVLFRYNHEFQYSALQGGDLPAHGKYEHEWLKPAEVPEGSDHEDSKLCPVSEKISNLLKNAFKGKDRRKASYI